MFTRRFCSSCFLLCRSKHVKQIATCIMTSFLSVFTRNTVHNANKLVSTFLSYNFYKHPNVFGRCCSFCRYRKKTKEIWPMSPLRLLNVMSCNRAINSNFCNSNKCVHNKHRIQHINHKLQLMITF